MALFHDGPVSSWPFQEIDLYDPNSPFSAILAQKVVNIYVIFTESQDIKPHAEFQLETETFTTIGGCETTIRVPISTKSISLGMNPHLLPADDADNLKASIIVGTPCLHREHIVSFKFPTTNMNHTQRKYLRVLRGAYKRVPPITEGGKLNPRQAEIFRKDLAHFYNGTPCQTGFEVPTKIIGSRDFVTQCMIRWEQNKMVPWEAVSAEGPHLPETFMFIPTFFKIITKPFRFETAPPHSDEDSILPRGNRIFRDDGPEIPMDRGWFGGRVTTSYGTDILYAPETSPDLEDHQFNTQGLSTAQAYLLVKPHDIHQTNPPSQAAYSPAQPLPLAQPLAPVHGSQTYQAYQGFQGQQGSYEQEGNLWQRTYTGPG